MFKKVQLKGDMEELLSFFHFFCLLLLELHLPVDVCSYKVMCVFVSVMN